VVRFDDRHRSLVSEDEDFRAFSGELLRATGRYGRPVAKDSGGKDGGIDLYCDDLELVVETKFVSSKVKSESDRVYQEWRNTKAKFARILQSDGVNANPLNFEYSPWGDSKRPISRYIFVTSARLASEARQRDLSEEIRLFFHNEIGSRSGYQHLKRIRVEVLDWSALEADLVFHPTISFRWLLRWPSGVAELDRDAPTGFRAYLFGEKLPYLARDKWLPPTGLRHSWTENTLINSHWESHRSTSGSIPP